jgi:1-pyrroline-5-carboxylate dehydrogenase
VATRRRDIARYRSYPRLVGETGGKDFVLVHASADAEAAAVAIARGGYEYQGQKCSAASRIYVAQSVWPEVRDRLIAMVRTMKMGDVRDFRNFMSAVIDRRAFDKINGYLTLAKKTRRCFKVGVPTTARASSSSRRSCRRRRRSPADGRGDLRPVVTAYVFPDRQWARRCD